MKSLMKSLPIIAKILGDKYGVRVEVGGSRACTDGNTINIPALPDDDRKAEILVRGYIDHESAHVRFKSGLLSGSALERALQNILEDIRIESRMKERYRGCGGNLNRMVDELVADGSFEPIKDNAHPGAVVQAFLLHRLRCDVLGQKALSSMADDSEARFHEVFSRGKATRIAALGYQAESAASVDEIKALVTRILASLEEPDEPDQSDHSDSAGADSSGDTPDDSLSDQGKGHSQPDDSDEPDEGQDQAGSSQDDAGDDDQPDSSDGAEEANGSDAPKESSSGNGAGDDGSEESNSSSAGKLALDADDDDLLEDIARIVGKELEGQVEDRDETQNVHISRDRSQHESLYRTPTRQINQHQARKATNALRSRLEGLIQASKHQRTPPKRHGRRIDSRELARLGRKDLRVFRARAEQTAVNTAVHILMDRSGSMACQIGIASEAMYATALAMESIADVSLETAVFPVVDDDVATLTRFGAKVRIEDYSVFAAGGTPLTPALRHVAYRLSLQPESRRIAIVVTDGAPNSPKQAVELAKRMSDYGIEVFGVGIGGMAHPELFDRHCVIKQVQELPRALFGMLEKALTAHAA